MLSSELPCSLACLCVSGFLLLLPSTTSQHKLCQVWAGHGCGQSQAPTRGSLARGDHGVLESVDFSGPAYRIPGRALLGLDWIMGLRLGQSEWPGRWSTVIGQTWITMSSSKVGDGEVYD